MIEWHNVSVGCQVGRHPLLRPTSLRIPKAARIGILAAPGSGKSTLARIFAGLEKPDTGKVLIGGDVSWPLGAAGFLHPELSIQQNLMTVARLKGQEPHAFIAACLEFADGRIDPSKATKMLSPSERALLAYCCAVCLPWDTLVADETITVGESDMRLRCIAMLDECRDETGLIFLSRNPSQLKRHCDQHFLFIGGTLKFCPDLDAGKEALALHERDKRHRHDLTEPA